MINRVIAALLWMLVVTWFVAALSWVVGTINQTTNAATRLDILEQQVRQLQDKLP